MMGVCVYQYRINVSTPLICWDSDRDRPSLVTWLPAKVVKTGAAEMNISVISRNPPPKVIVLVPF